MSSPLVDWAQGLYNKYRKYAGDDTDKTEAKKSTGADAKMVEEANESFRKKASKASADPKLGSAKKSASKKGKKKQAAKK